MGSKLVGPMGLTAAALALTACGGSSGSHATGSDSAFVSKLSTSSRTLVRHDPNLASGAGDQTKAYLVSMAGWGGSAARGRTATARLFLYASRQGACWTIRAIHGFAGALAVRIHRKSDRSSRTFVSLSSGQKFKALGCTYVRGSKLKAIEADPSAFYIAVRSNHFPNGAVRGRL
jgi:hypothetical protein